MKLAATTLITGLVAALVVLPVGANASRPRIVGGTTVKPSQWPWVARVLVNNPGSVSTCTGSVVAPNVVLTAGHCASAAWRFEVITGATSTAPGGQTSRVSAVVREPSFVYRASNQGGLADYDATLLKLSTPTTEPVIKLATVADAALYRPGTRASVAGWGWTSYAGKTNARRLREGTMQLLGQPVCASDSKAALALPLDTTDQLCAVSATRRTGICEGDSGGPLVASGAHGAPVEIGITIFNSGKCSTRAPDYFTSVIGLAGWLEHEVRKLAGRPGPNTPQLLAGAYRGASGQRLPVAITVAPSQNQVSAVSARVQLRCTRLHGSLAYTVRPMGSRYWPRTIATSGIPSFADAFRDARGWRVALQASFTTEGTAKGQITVVGGNRSDGTCRSGTVLWTAKLA